MILPFLVAKIVAGIAALIIANALSPFLLEKASASFDEGQEDAGTLPEASE